MKRNPLLTVGTHKKASKQHQELWEQNDDFFSNKKTYTVNPIVNKQNDTVVFFG